MEYTLKYINLDKVKYQIKTHTHKIYQNLFNILLFFLILFYYQAIDCWSFPIAKLYSLFLSLF